MNTPGRRGVVAATATIGVGLSGFFDGILLHQVLQWHHLLSLVPGETVQQLRTQILADGLFHVLMYAITALGLWLLWRRRVALADPRNGGWRTVAGGGLVGFGLWNVADVGLFHWILGIHRIRVDVPDPLTYDLAWIVALGLVPTLIGLRLLHRPAGRGGKHAGTVVAALAMALAPIPALPFAGSKTGVVLLPGNAAAAYNMAADAGTPPIWLDASGGLMVVSLSDPGAERALYRAGALLVTRSPVLAGCLAATRV